MKKIFLFLVSLSFYSANFGQTTSQQDSIFKELNEVIISASKFPEKKINIAQRIDVITSKFIATVNAQNTGDLLLNSGNVFVQKSQQGGSSPVLRGFEASRVLLIVDGVRLNNLIYRTGHLQNAITVDQNMLERMEVLYGPASTLYGSDALGGVVHFRTKSPRLAANEKSFSVSGNSFARYSFVNNEKTVHADVNFGWKKIAWLQSYTFSDFGNVTMGKNYPNKYPDFGKRDSFITRINGIDSVVKNSNPNVQKFSGFKQWDILQKILFKQNEKISHILNFQYSNSTNIPRYDRLQDKRNFGGSIGNTLRYAEWYYGPQKKLMTSYELSIGSTGFFDAININLNYQNIEESRQTREYRRYDRFDSRVEKVNVFGFVVDSRKVWGGNELTVGVDGQFNHLKSTAGRININTGAVTKLDTRYPNGKNNMNSAGIFVQHLYKFKNKKLVVNDGFRLQTISLLSTIADNTLFNLPYTEITQNNFTVTGNMGIIYLPQPGTKLSLNFATGFRAPNVDDLSKIFESSTSARQLVVPNPNIKPEKTYSFDLGISENFGKNIRIEASGFYTFFKDALVKAPFQLNGQDSIVYDGVKSQVLANVNANKAYLYGLSAAFYATVANYFTLSSTINYTIGRYLTDDSKNSLVFEKQADGSYKQVSKKVSSKPLDHIPPIFGKTSIGYQNKKLMAEVFALYNGWKYLDEFNADGEDNAQYATPDGIPAWATFNFRSSFSLQKNITLQFAIENVFDKNYRNFASGFSAPGRNFVIAVRAGF